MKDLIFTLIGWLCVAILYGQEVKKPSLVNYEYDYVYGQMGYGVADINHNSFELALRQFNQTNLVNGIGTINSSLPMYSGLSFNSGIVNTNFTNDIMVNVNVSMFSSNANFVDNMGSYKYYQNFYQMNLSLLYMPLAGKYIDMGIGLGGDYYMMNIKNKTEANGLMMMDKYNGFGIVFMVNAHIFPFSKKMPLMFNLKPYYFADLRSSVFESVNEINRNPKDSSSDVTNVGNFSYFGIEAGVGFIIKSL